MCLIISSISLLFFLSLTVQNTACGGKISLESIASLAPISATNGFDYDHIAFKSSIWSALGVALATYKKVKMSLKELISYQNIMC